MVSPLKGGMMEKSNHKTCEKKQKTGGGMLGGEQTTVEKTETLNNGEKKIYGHQKD